MTKRDFYIITYDKIKGVIAQRQSGYTLTHNGRVFGLCAPDGDGIKAYDVRSGLPLQTSDGILKANSLRDAAALVVRRRFKYVEMTYHIVELMLGQAAVNYAAALGIDQYSVARYVNNLKEGYDYLGTKAVYFDGLNN